MSSLVNGKTGCSVAMCTYNGLPYLPAQLESILAQTRRPNEVVICDDGSTDGTVKLLREFVISAPFPVRLSMNPSNLGVARNFEQAARLCEGEFIAFADQDDVWMGDKLERLVEAMTGSPGALLSFSDGICIDEGGFSLGFSLWDECGRDCVDELEKARDRQLLCLLHRDLITGATAMIHRDLLLYALPIPEGWLHDAWFAAVAGALNRIVIVREPLIQYRIHQQQRVGVSRGRLTEHVKAKIQNGKISDLAKFRQLESIFQQRQLGSHLSREVHEKVDHLQVRSSFSTQRLLRTGQIVKEALSGRYHRFSSGFKSIVLDVIRK